jgi:hypothetical protein
MAADYHHTMKWCSNLIHPTAWSIISMKDDEDEYGKFRPMLFRTGVRYGLDAFNTIIGLGG